MNGESYSNFYGCCICVMPRNPSRAKQLMMKIHTLLECSFLSQQLHHFPKDVFHLLLMCVVNKATAFKKQGLICRRLGAKKAGLSLRGPLGKREGICHNRAGNWANVREVVMPDRKWQGEM